MLKISFLVLTLMLIFIDKVHAGEKSLYDFLWLDPDKKVYVLQNKLYKKDHTFYGDVGFLTNFTSKFQSTNGYQIKAGYYFHEEWGVEMTLNNYSNSNNDEFRNIQVVNAQEPFIRRLNSTYGLLGIWSPFYGKINTFNQIFYFDWSFGAGLMKIDAESNLQSIRIGNMKTTFKKESYTGAVLKTNLKFHLRENVHLGVEYMNTYYKAAGPRNPEQDKLRTNTDIILSIGFSY
jgi:outer membrane beta-barrel protein